MAPCTEIYIQKQMHIKTGDAIKTLDAAHKHMVCVGSGVIRWRVLVAAAGQ